MSRVRAATLLVVFLAALVLPATAWGQEGQQTEPSQGTEAPGHDLPFDVEIQVSRQFDQPSELYVPVRVTVTRKETGEVATDVVHEVVARPTNVLGTDGGLFTLTADVAGTGGEYRGMVILPHEGAWTIEVSVNDPPPPRGREGIPPTVLGRGSLDVTVTGGILDSARGVYDPLRARVLDNSGTYARSIAVFWLHSLSSAGWMALILLIGALGHRGVRSWLADPALTWFDLNLPRLDVAARWLLGVAVLTGVVNVVSELAYGVPTTSAQMERTTRLPYAVPYLMAFLGKMALFALMVGLSVVIVRRTRRVRDEWDAVTLDGEEHDEGVDVSDVWEQSSNGGGGGRTTATIARGTLTEEERERDARHEDRRARLRTIAYAVSGALLLLCVTMLKHVHLIIEAYRAR